MIELLQKATAEVSKLPDEQQDAIAPLLLAELQGEQSWQARFEAIGATQPDSLAATVRQDIAANKALPLQMD